MIQSSSEAIRYVYCETSSFEKQYKEMNVFLCVCATQNQLGRNDRLLERERAALGLALSGLLSSERPALPGTCVIQIHVVFFAPVQTARETRACEKRKVPRD